MKIKRMLAALMAVVILATVAVFPTEVNAASEFYGDYTDVSKIYDYGSCPGMQGLAVGSQKLYTVKVNSNDTLAFISMTDKDTGYTEKLYNSDAGSYYFDYLGHANDMDVWGIDGYSNIFVTTTNEGSNSIVRLKRDGTNLTKVASYSLTYEGSSTWVSALAIKSVSNGVITFIGKLGMDLFTGSVSTSATSANIELTKLCTISKSKVYIKGEYLDLSTFVNQGMGYHDGVLYVPISGDDNWLERSVIMVFNLDGAVGTIYPSEAIVFRVTSSAYSALMEIESCDICSGDGKLYFNANRRVTDSNTNHDGVSYFDGYTFVKLTEPAKTMGYTIQYEANGGTGTMEDTVVPYGINTPLRTNTFTRNGYKFAGWTAYRTTQKQWYYTNGSSSGWYAEGSQPSGYSKSIYSDGVNVAKTSSVDGDVVIMYAQWEPSTYTVRYNANGGTGTMADTTVTYGVSTNLRKNTFVRTGYTFAGWQAYRTAQAQWYYTDGTNTGWYAEGSQPSGYIKFVYNDGVAVAKTTGVDGDVVNFYAQWTPNTYTVKFLDDDGTLLSEQKVAYDQMPTAPANPTKPSDDTYSYTFAGWDKDITAVTGDTTYTATYTAESIGFTVKFVDEDGTVLSEQKVAYGKLPTAPADPHKFSDLTYTYTFAGWDKPITAVTGDTTYTATYTPKYINYTIRFVDEDGTVLSVKNYHYGDTVNLPSEPAKSGNAQYSYVFAGWSPAVATVTGNATYTATYTKVTNQYTVTFQNDDGTVLKSEKLAYGKMPTAPANPTKAADANYSYTFAGWNKDIVAVTGNATYTATYTATALKSPTINLKYPALSFEDEIVLNVFFDTTDLEGVALEDMGMITFSSNVADGNINNAEAVIPGVTLNGSFYCARTEGIAAKKLGDSVYFRIYAKLSDGSYIYSQMANYSPKKYAYSVLNGNYDDDMKALVVAMLNYGSEAQKYFSYNTDALVNADMTAEQLALVDAYREDMVNSVIKADSAKTGNFVNNGGFSKRYPSISFEGAFCINYFFTPAYTVDGNITLYYWSAADYNSVSTLTTANATGSVVATAGSEYEAIVEGIAAKDLDGTVYVAAVYTSNGTTYCSGVLAYSIGAYCTDRIANGSATMQGFASATAVYGYYAKVYFSK